MSHGCFATLALPALTIVGVVSASKWGLRVACCMVLPVHVEIASALCEEQKHIFHFQQGFYCCAAYIAELGKNTEK